MYRNLGLDLHGCAKLLHVTERTLHNWESGKHDIPYAAYRLLRLLNRMELPGDSWAGWCFYGGRLWSPEGRSFVGTDSAWWSLLVRRAACFDTLYQRCAASGDALAVTPRGPEGSRLARGAPACGGTLAGREASSSPAPAGGRREAPALDLSIEHFRTDGGYIPAFYGPVATTFVAVNAPQWKLVQGGQP